MDLIWKQNEATVSQLVEAIGRRRSITYTTVLSAVQKLEKKGWLKHRAEGRAYVFYATRGRKDVGARTLKELLRTAFSGDPRLLLSSLLEDARLSDADLRELRQLIEERRKERRDEQRP
jgi:predicted transcriptional regulator